MRLAKVTLAGFKSFADKTVIAFDAPIVGVVGPNGCGKSNIVDAIKWVLGEQSAKSLRGGAMMDVIFNGSANRRPSGMASVTLTFDNAHKPDGMLVGLARDLGWSDYRVGDNLRRYKLPTTTLGELAADIKKRKGIRTLRVVGKPETKVSKVALSPGFTSLRGAMRSLRDADVLVAGEPREWEGVEYAQDAVAAGESKGLIILGHAVGEDPGMGECAKWLRSIISEVPIEFLPAGEPFWTPG